MQKCYGRLDRDSVLLGGLKLTKFYNLRYI